MKKTSVLTLISLVLLVVLVGLFLYPWFFSEEEDVTDEFDFYKTEIETPSKDVSKEPSNDKSETVSDSVESDFSEESSYDSYDEPSKEPSNEPSNEPSEEPKPENKPSRTVSLDDALFIGDSRTVGFMEYSGITEADYFCSVGMSVYNLSKTTANIDGMGDMSLPDLLNAKKYGKVYIMLGVNEVGYNFNTTVSKYKELVQLVEDTQPDAFIFIQANLHVSKKRSDRDSVVNNTAINRLNYAFSELADGITKFYIDANEIFDDKNGALASDKSGDGTHLYGKYYKVWGDWIKKETASCIIID